MSQRTVTYGCFVLLLLGVVVEVDAQSARGTIFGIVSDATGGVLPGAEVTIRNLDTGLERLQLTNDQGRYRADQLPLGDNYQVEATLAGFSTQVRSGIELNVGSEVTVDFSLSVGEISDRVEVTAEAPLVDTTSATLGGLVTSETISELPLNGRNYTQLALLEPGVIRYREHNAEANRGMGIKMNISGARGNQIGFRYEGLDISDAAGTTPGSSTGSNLGTEAIREFRVMTNNYSAEYGKAAGAVINVALKSGTNAIHGTASYFHRNDNLDARSFFDAGDQPEFRRHQFGASIGGPIVKDRTFIFGAYEGLREAQGRSNITRVLTPAVKNGTSEFGPIDPILQPYIDVMPDPTQPLITDGVADPNVGILNVPLPTTGDEDYFSIKFDDQLTDDDSISVTYTFDQAAVLREPNRGALPIYDLTQENRYQYTTIQQTHIFSPTSLNTLRIGYNRSFAVEVANPNPPVDQSILFIPGLTKGRIQVDGFANIDYYSDTNQNRVDQQDSYQYSDVVSINKGSHSIKFGAEWTHRFFRDQSQSRTFSGLYRFSNLGNFLNMKARRFEADKPDAPQVPSIWQDVFGFFINDQFSVNDRVTMNLGLRYEFITVPRSNASDQCALVRLTDEDLTCGHSQITNPSLKNFQPRIGIAWDLGGNGKTAIRMGAGLFHDQISSYYYLPIVRANPPYRLGARLNNPTAPFPDAFEELDAIPLDETRFRLSVLEYNLSNPYRIQYNFGIQHEFLPETVLNVAYVGAGGVNSSQFHLNINQNRPIGTGPDGRLLFPDPDTCTPVAGADDGECTILNPNFATDVQYRATGGHSQYHSLQASVNRRMSAGLQFQGSYTWSKSLDNGSFSLFSSEGANTVSLQNQYDLSSERGQSAFDARHNFTFNGLYDIPFGNNLSGPMRNVVGGWRFGGIVTAASGHPFTPVLSYDHANILTRSGGDDLRPDLAPGASTNPVNDNPADKTDYFDPSGFILPPPQTLGNLGRQTMVGPKVVSIDFSLHKNFSVAENANLSFRAEVFNLFNRANFRGVDDDFRVVFDDEGRVPGAGRLTQTSISNRQVQFGMRLEF